MLCGSGKYNLNLIMNLYNLVQPVIRQIGICQRAYHISFCSLAWLRSMPHTTVLTTDDFYALWSVFTSATLSDKLFLLI